MARKSHPDANIQISALDAIEGIGTQPEPPGTLQETEPKSAGARPKPTGVQPKPTGVQPKPGTPPLKPGTQPKKPKSTKRRLKLSGTQPKVKPITLRIPANILQPLEAVRKALPVKLTRTTYILQAIHERLSKDLQRKR
jgi:hypothetical protein